jgi:hypothetical protein
MNIDSRSLRHGLLALLAAGVLAACGGRVEPPSLNQVGPAGGSVTINGVRIDVPAGALSAPTTLSVSPTTTSPAAPQGATAVGTAFDLGPAGTTFAQPVTVTLPFDATQVGSGNEAVLFKGNGTDWAELPAQTIAAGSVSATTTSFSPFRVFAIVPRPSIVQQPAGVSVQQPGAASFSVTAQAGNFWAYRWERRRPNDAAFAPIDASLEPSAASARYTTQVSQVTPANPPAATEAANGTLYRVVVASTRGSVTSAAALLTVTSQPTPPTLTQQPQDLSVQAPAAATFTIAATGGTPPLAIQWERSNNGAGPWSPINGEPSATTPTYTKASTDAGPAAAPPGDNGARFRAVVTDANGASVISAAALLTVSPAVIAPTISSQPRDKFVTEGVVASFQVAASGTMPNYQWERSNNNGASWVVVGGGPIYATGPANPAAAANGGDFGARFRVIVSNSAGSVTSNVVTLTVGALGQAADVFVQYPPASVTFSNTLATATGAGYAATADLAAGSFRARADGMAPENNRLAYAGARRLRFINNSGATVTIAAGDLRASFSATYTLRPNALGTAAAADLILTVSHPGGTSSARSSHQVVIGNNGVSSEVFTPVESGGGSVVIAARGMGGISGELRMPSIVLAAGAEMTLTVLAQAIVTLALADLETVPMQLTLDLPPGVTLDDSAMVPLGAWVF